MYSYIFNLHLDINSFVDVNNIIHSDWKYISRDGMLLLF